MLSDVYCHLGHDDGETCNHAVCYEHSGFIVTSIYTRDINSVSHLLTRIQGDTIVANIKGELPSTDHSICGKVLPVCMSYRTNTHKRPMLAAGRVQLKRDGTR